jgi:hypothetical protein
MPACALSYACPASKIRTKPSYAAGRSQSIFGERVSNECSLLDLVSKNEERILCFAVLFGQNCSESEGRFTSFFL